MGVSQQVSLDWHSKLAAAAGLVLHCRAEADSLAYQPAVDWAKHKMHWVLVAQVAWMAVVVVHSTAVAAGSRMAVNAWLVVAAFAEAVYSVRHLVEAARLLRWQPVEHSTGGAHVSHSE